MNDLNDYTTRRGVGSGVEPDIYAIPYAEHPDDGKILIGSGHSPACPDCRGRGDLTWAEAGFTSYHRICNYCGSHWELHPMTYHRAPGRGWDGTGPGGVLRSIALMDPDPILPRGVTHIQLIAAAMDCIEPNGGDEKNGHIAAASWARRARFYGG